MSNKTRKGIYWTEVEENLVLQWLSANTLQEYRIYNALHPKIYRMQEIILHRYFSYSSARHTEIMRDCCDHVFLQLRMFKPDRDKKAYSFVQTVIKNYCLDMLVNSKKREKNEMYQDTNKLELDSTEILDNVPDVLIVPETNYFVDVQELRQKAIERLENDLAIVRNDLKDLREEIYKTKGRKRISRKIWLNRSKNRIKRREYLKLAIKFFKTHQSMHINHNAFNDYIYENSMTLYASTVDGFTNEYIGIIGKSNGKSIDKHNGEYGKNAQEIGMPYFMDDLSPKDYALRSKRQRIYKKQSQYLYF
jgi:hypothetical protein